MEAASRSAAFSSREAALDAASLSRMPFQGDQLMADVPGRGRGPMVPQSATHFSFSGATIEFVTNEKGEVPYFIVHVVEGD